MQIDDPLLIGAVVALIAVVVAARQVQRWRRARALQARAAAAGWQPIPEDQGQAFADLVRRAFPQLGDEVAGEAHRGSVRPRGGAGSTIRLGRRRTRLSSGARNVHILPVEGGSTAIGDVRVTAAQGAAGQQRASTHHGAVAAELGAPLPDVTLTARTWVDHDTDEELPEALGTRFSAPRVTDEARRVYLGDRVTEVLGAAPDGLRGVAVTDGTLVLLADAELTPERAEALADTADRFAARALERTGDAPDTAGSDPTRPSRVRSPLTSG